MNLTKNRRKKAEAFNAEAEWSAIRENEAEANRYAAKCLTVCAGVCALSWLLNILGLFTIPAAITNIGMPVTILFLLMPALICRFTNATGGWFKYMVMFCGTFGIFVLACAMPKHSVVAWTLPLTLSCHYYSKRLTHLTLAASWILFSVSIYIGMYLGEGDLNLFFSFAGFEDIIMQRAKYDATIFSVFPRILTGKMLRHATLLVVLPRALILLAISSICTTVASRTRRLLENQIKDSVEHQRISTELDVATRIQGDMLPCIFPAFPERSEFDIYASMNPAKEVGGDFYDFFMVDDTHLAIVIADVSGKGVPAALFMVIGKTLLKDHTKPGRDPGEIFSEVNDLLCESNSEGLFITAFEGILDLATGEFRFVNAGHEMPFIARAGSVYEPYKIKPAFVLAGMEGMKYQSGCIRLSPGDKIFQYTDGVTEATNAANELYGMERLTNVLAKNAAKKPAELLVAVKADIDAFVGDAPQFDDITMLCLEYKERMEDHNERA